MPVSLFAVQILGSKPVNVLAQDAGSTTALQAAIAAAANLGLFLSAQEVGGKPVDVTIPFATAPAIDCTPKAEYRVDFRAGSGPNGSSPQSLLVLAWNQRAGNVITRAALLASQAAATQASAVVSQVMLLGQVDQDVTGVGPTTSTDLTKFAFRCLFTFDELVGIDNFQASATLTAEQKATLNTIMLNFQAAEDIELTDPAIIEGVQYLVSCNLLTAARAQQVLANQPYLRLTAPNFTGQSGVAITPVNLTASGGSRAGYSFSASLPTGLQITLSGEITGTLPNPGVFTYTATVTDSAGDTASAQATIAVS
jgi:hypothetical protein